MDNVVETARAALTGGAVGRVSSLLHESEGGTRQALLEALPVSVAGLAGRAATPEGAQELLEGIKAGRYARVEPEQLDDTVADPGKAARVVSSGERLSARLFGPRLDGIVDHLAGDAGVSPAVAAKLLGLATPLVMGVVGKLALARDLDARRLSGFLSEQKRLAGIALPGRMASLVGVAPAYGGGANFARHSQRVVRLGQEAARGRSLWPWMLPGLVVMAGALLVQHDRRRELARERVITTMAVGPAAVEEVAHISAAGGVATLEATMENAQPLPARFVLSDLTFPPGSAEIDLSTAQVLDQVVGVLKAHPTARVRIENHTNEAGPPDANLSLSRQRAESVKAYLAAQDIPADHVATAGLGATPSLNSPQPQAQDHRTDLLVTAR
jgi:OOP family OmpA-OmpF porin